MTLWRVICEAEIQVTPSTAASAESFARDDAGEFMADNFHTISEAWEVSAEDYDLDDPVQIEACASPAEGEEEPDEEDDDADEILWDATASLTVIVEADTEEEAHEAALARLKKGGEYD